jgi:soluble lytic murein transglycosylase-like protein
MTIATTLLILIISRVDVPAELEIAAWAILHGVPADVALAVADQETGSIAPAKRDRVVSRGNYGRFQVNCTTWRKAFGLRTCAELIDRHTNIRIGAAVLAHCKSRWPRIEDYVAHYNCGSTINAAGRRYAGNVLDRIRRMHQSNRRW